MKVSIITAVLNRKGTILSCLESVKSQGHSNLEHIIIDGGSTDGTLEILKEYHANSAHTILVTEPDTGIYEAINKGIQRATGDIIGFLHSDDIFSRDDAINEVVKCITINSADGCYGNCHYYYTLSEKSPIRIYTAKPYWNNLLKFGIIPPHSTLFLKYDIYKKLGIYNTNYMVCGDFEYFCRIDKSGVKLKYCPNYTVNMQYGGVSTSPSNRRIINEEIYNILNNYRHPNLKFLIYLRYILKIFELKPLAFLKLKVGNKNV